MKLISLLFGSAAILSACQEETDIAFPALEDGTYHLEIFNEQGEQVLTRDGNAIGLGTYSQLIIEDPLFGSSAYGDKDDKFAALWLSTENTFQQTWNERPLWFVSEKASGALLTQQYYGSSTDWRYVGVSGEIKILEATDKRMKGYFEIKMRVQPPDEDNPIMQWTANSKWGAPILVKGYFISKGW